MENTSGTGKLAHVPPELEGWNWVAFIGGWYWAFVMDLPLDIQLRAGIPLFGNLMSGWKGYEWAWRYMSWADAGQLIQKQRRSLWKIVALMLMAPAVVLMMIIMTYR